MLELIASIAVAGLAAVLYRQQQRINVLEFDLEGLRTAFLAHREALMGGAYGQAAEAGAATEQSGAAEPQPAEKQPAEAPAETAQQIPLAARVAPETVALDEPAGPWAEARRARASSPEPSPAAPAAAPRKKPDIETALGTRWAVWVGGLALALGGVFLIRYTIEAGIFGPEVRLAMAALFGLVLVGGGEAIRRTGFAVPVEGIRSAYLPAILTAAGAFVLFGTVYAAHGIYGFIGPAAAFTLLGLVGVATIAAALVHGQALAGLGLLGSYLTPLLVASDAPNLWALFGFIAIVLAAAGAIARLRDWLPLMVGAFVGAGLWNLAFVAIGEATDMQVVLFSNLAALAVLAFVWLSQRGPGEAARFDVPSAVASAFVALVALGLAGDASRTALLGLTTPSVLLLALLAVALFRPSAIAALHTAGGAAVLVFVGIGMAGTFEFELWHETVTIVGAEPGATAPSARLWGATLGVAFLAAGLWSASRLTPSAPLRATAWAIWAAAVPLVTLLAVWVAFGNLDRDYAHAAIALLLTVALAAGGEFLARQEQPPLTGGLAVSTALAGAGLALVLFLHMGFGPGLTTMLLGLAIALPAAATRLRTYPVLGWLSVGAVLFVLVRMAIDPSIVGSMALGTTAILNALLPGYGLPAIAAALAAWQLARTTDGRPRLAMEAAAALFALLTLAMLVRHAMNGGEAPTLAEQAIYTLIAIGGGAILIALDRRAPSPVFRIGSMAIGLLSIAFIVIQHFGVLNPLFTNESTGGIVFFNLLFLAYLLPGLALAGVALYARDKRPRWYVGTIAVVAAVLGFTYATLSVRRLFQGEFIGLWKDFGQIETYSYSALWLAMGVALLVLGLKLRSQVLRFASAALVVIAVAKVFLLDMAELEGVLRALSFIGLGIVLIGIGLFYQRMLTRMTPPEAEDIAAAEPAPPPT
jgi:uncharacterized membrane protein